jgi:4-aminobutyrate aminotransferase / (S)-3-amino-2-methylpropionate transaminase
LMNVRGVGTLVAADLAERDRAVKELRAEGVDIAFCGEAAIRCRPGLYFTPEHARVFLDAFDRVLRRM